MRLFLIALLIAISYAQTEGDLPACSAQQNVAAIACLQSIGANGNGVFVSIDTPGGACVYLESAYNCLPNDVCDLDPNLPAIIHTTGDNYTNNCVGKTLEDYTAATQGDGKCMAEGGEAATEFTIHLVSSDIACYILCSDDPTCFGWDSQDGETHGTDICTIYHELIQGSNDVSTAGQCWIKVGGGDDGESYCQGEAMLRNAEACMASSCCHWNTEEEGDASFNGEGRCWSSIGQDICTDISEPLPSNCVDCTENAYTCWCYLNGGECRNADEWESCDGYGMGPNCANVASSTCPPSTDTTTAPEAPVESSEGAESTGAASSEGAESTGTPSEDGCFSSALVGKYCSGRNQIGSGHSGVTQTECQSRCTADPTCGGINYYPSAQGGQCVLFTNTNCQTSSSGASDAIHQMRESCPDCDDNYILVHESQYIVSNEGSCGHDSFTNQDWSWGQCDEAAGHKYLCRGAGCSPLREFHDCANAVKNDPDCGEYFSTETCERGSVWTCRCLTPRGTLNPNFISNSHNIYRFPLDPTINPTASPSFAPTFIPSSKPSNAPAWDPICDQDTMVSWLIANNDESVISDCQAAIETEEDMQLHCICWRQLDQTWLYENFDCYWEAEIDTTLLELYTSDCFGDTTGCTEECPQGFQPYSYESFGSDSGSSGLCVSASWSYCGLCGAENGYHWVMDSCYTVTAEEESMDDSMDSVDCDQCVADFAAAQGCECWRDEFCDQDMLVPDGCQSCGEQAGTYCGISEDEPEDIDGESYCENESMLRNEEACMASSCCHWNTSEEGEASFNGEGRCWSSIGQDVCTDMGLDNFTEGTDGEDSIIIIVGISAGIACCILSVLCCWCLAPRRVDKDDVMENIFEHSHVIDIGATRPNEVDSTLEVWGNKTFLEQKQIEGTFSGPPPSYVSQEATSPHSRSA